MTARGVHFALTAEEECSSSMNRMRTTTASSKSLARSRNGGTVIGWSKLTRPGTPSTAA